MGNGRTSTSPLLSPAMGRFLVLVLVGCVGVLDFATPANVVTYILYVMPVLLCTLVRDRYFLWIITTGGVLLIVFSAIFGEPPTTGAPLAVIWTNRTITMLALLIVSTIVHLWITSQALLESAQSQLEQQNVQLQASNEELAAREEEIARQNEELQSQTEELERQAEELRTTNDELIQREQTLERLLEISRTITVDMPRQKVLEMICQALRHLIGGEAPATAILEREGRGFRVAAHDGFGIEGPDLLNVDLENSLAGLAMDRGMTAFIDDLRLRPDLRVPQPRTGEPFRSALCCPLRSRGSVIGVLEVYDRAVHGWNDDQVALVESLSVQSSISLDAARLMTEVHHERQRFEAVFRTMPIGVFVADDQSCMRVRGNRTAATLYGVTSDANFSPVAPEDQRVRRTLLRNGKTISADEHPLVRAARNLEEIRGEEVEVLFPDGRHLHLLASAAPIEEAGQPRGGVCAFIDITSIKNLQRELELRRREAEEASGRKTRFLAALSHDIRTPANAISLFAELIRRAAGTPALIPEIPDMAKELHNSAMSLVSLVSDVLDLARFDSGRIELQEREFDLNQAILDECRQLQPVAQEKKLEMRVEGSSQPIIVRTDRVKLARVIGNLLGNAIKFTETGGIYIQAFIAADRTVCIRVRDTGIGIAPEHLAHIFDEFFQLRNPERDRAKGTGLGLTICKRLTEVMGGRLTVESTPGQGSTFTVILPASTVVAGGEPVEPATPVSISGDGDGRAKPLADLRVLLVEDHPATRRATAHILRAEGALLAEAADGETAKQLLYGFQPHVLLLDMMLPDLDGREILRMLQSKRPESLERILVLTGDMTSERAEEVRSLGADALLSKPVNLDRLLLALQGPGSSARVPTDATLAADDQSAVS